jgi:hypothetical protein
MSNLTLITQGVKGGKIKTSTQGKCIIELGCVNDTIEVDNYEGAGSTYSKREQTEITITENGEVLFKGTKSELFSILLLSKLS